MGEGKNASPMGLYDIALGEKNRAYFVNKFQEFDQKGPGLKISWNWAAFFFGGIWALYRKMYGWFFAWWFVATVLTVFKTIPNALIQLILVTVAGAFWLGFAVFANSLYHSKIKARIAAANKAEPDATLVSGRLRARGGIHSWVPIVFGAIPVIGIVAAVALPAFLDKTNVQVASTQSEVTSPMPALAEAEPELPATSQLKPVDAGAANKQARTNRLTPEQVARNEWNRAENAAMNSFKNEGLDYRAKPALLAAYNTHLKALGADPKNERRDAAWFLNEAHRMTKGDLGIATKTPKLGIPVNPSSGLVFTNESADNYDGDRYISPAAPAAAPAVKELGPIDRWRYESCQQDASQAPTQTGVTVGLRICRKKFAQ